MRIFTLGKNGIPLFFFALILFSGTYSSYGQECPTVDADDSTQYFCDAGEAEIGDLVVTTGTNVVWYDSQTSTTPLANTRFLVNGTTYYAGTADGSCINNRAAVTVQIASQPVILGLESTFNPPASNKQSVGGVTIIGVCVADINDPGVTVGDIRTNVQDESQVRWYSSRTGDTALSTDTQLQNNTDYYASFISWEGEVFECETNRSRVTVRLFSEDRPSGDSQQTFCASQNPTLADIVASGNNNFYRTATSQTELSPNTLLVHDRTYYLSTVGENCESFERLPVTVILNDPAVTSVSAVLCQQDVPSNPDEAVFEQYFRNLMGNPGAGTFSPDMADLLNQFQEEPTGEFFTRYTLDEGCEAIEATVTVNPTEEANAGEIEDQTLVCSADVLVLDENLLDTNATPGGIFTAEEGVLNADGNFDPAIGAGTYVITYTVGESISCVIEEDSTTFTITVEVPYAGEDQDLVFCQSEIEAFASDIPAALAFFDEILEDQEGEVDTTGEFSRDPLEFLAYFAAGDFTSPFELVYSVGEGDCGDTANISITILEDQIAEAGEIEDITVSCPATEIIELNDDLLSEDATRGGTFTAEEGVLNDEGNFDPSIGFGEYVITYTVGEDLDCVTGTSSTTFTITVETEETLDPISITLCEDQIPNPLTTAIVENYYRSQIASRTGLPEGGTLTNDTPEEIRDFYNTNPFQTFTSVYTVETECGTASVEMNVTVRETPTATVGEIEDITVACDATEIVVLNNAILPAGTTRGGTFTAEEGVLNEQGNFDPAVGPGTYTITYAVSDSQTCVTGDASDTFNIIVGEGTVTEEPISVQLCEEQVEDPSVDGFTSYFESQLSLNDIPTGGEFNPTMDTLVAQYEQNPVGIYTTTYSVVTDCEETEVVISVQVLEAVASETFDDVNIEFCEAEDVQNLDDYLPEGYPAGTFEGYEDRTFDPATAEIGVTTVNYVITPAENTCIAGGGIIAFNITVNALEEANAGDDVEIVYCVGQDMDVQLTSLLTNGAQTTGSFDLYEDGIFNPATEGVGEYEITYTVDGDEDCATGTDSSIITISVIDEFEAPTADDATFCAVQNATVANLFDFATGQNLRWYTNAELTAPADEDEQLTGGAYYVTQTTSGGCESEATVVTVTITDVDAPTLEEEGNVFCEADRPTIADLTNNVVEGGEITWYDAETGGTAYSSSTVLQNGTTYYATITDATSGCESAQRLAVRVTVERCELIIPEAFSPNGDGVNERFEIDNIAEQYPNYTIEIFNRWGNTVYTGNASTPFWDGVSTESRTLGSNVLPVGVYFYILNYNDGQTAPTQGRVYLSR